MTTTLHLVRHGEADESTDDDPGLTDLGRAQAKSIGRRLSPLGCDVVLHSSRRRARETAMIVAACLPGGRVEHSAHADDRTPIPSDPTTVAGMSAARRSFFATVPAAERDEDGRALDAAVAALGHDDGTERRIVVVTHNFVIGWFVRAALDAPPLRWIGLNAAHCSLTTIRDASGEPPRLITYNDTGHLAV